MDHLCRVSQRKRRRTALSETKSLPLRGPLPFTMPRAAWFQKVQFFCVFYVPILFRSDAVEEDGDDGENDIRKPECYSRRECTSMDEHLTEAKEEDVCKRQSDAYTYVPTDTATTLLR